MQRRDVFTTSEVASICQVSTRVVTKWFDTGILEGFRLPASKHRRFTYDNLKTFMTKEEMPVEWLDIYVEGRVTDKVNKIAEAAVPVG